MSPSVPIPDVRYIRRVGISVTVTLTLALSLERCTYGPIERPLRNCSFGTRITLTLLGEPTALALFHLETFA